MYQPVIVDPAAPPAVRRFLRNVDLYLGDVHAMLRLPRPEIEIQEGCNLAIAAVLLNIISGVSAGRPGLSETDLEALERSVLRPDDLVLHDQATLTRYPETGEINLSVEPFYWGVREMLRRLTTDPARMAAADEYLRPHMKGGA
jgi:hypothetical protein